MEVLKLREPETGAELMVAPGLGMNAFSWQLPIENRQVEILWSEPDFESGDQRPSGSGTPLLFPFPGRIAKGLLDWEGRQFQLPQGDGRGNAIHGFVLNRAWRVIEQSDASVTAEFQASLDLENWEQYWPADFIMRCRYRLRPAELEISLEVENPDQRRLPCGLGLHPYFQADTNDPDLKVQLPVSAKWELDSLIPTGVQQSFSSETMFKGPMEVAGRDFDDVLTGIDFQNEVAQFVIDDVQRGVQVTQTWGTEFPHCVVYIPPHRQAICIEPYSCLPNAAALHRQGVSSGMWILDPGELKRMAVHLQVGSI